MRTGGEFSFTGDVRSTNSNLVNSNDAALYAFTHCHIHVILTVCCTLVLFKKKYMIPNVHKLPRILSALLVTVLFTSYLITFVLIIYLFVKMLCLLKYKYVYFFYFFLIHFQIISILNMN